RAIRETGLSRPRLSIRRPPQGGDQILDRPISRRKPRQALSIVQRSGNLAGITGESDQRQQDVTVFRKAGRGILENSDRLAVASRRIERDRINVNVTRPIRLELARMTELGERRLRSLEPDKRQSERMMQAAVTR